MPSLTETPPTPAPCPQTPQLAGTPWPMRVVEYLSLAAFTVFCVLWGLPRLGDGLWHAPIATLAGFVFAVALADFVSGLVHWGADTWGTIHWPIVGPTLIRSFREHHVDPMAITRHDFVETNGASALVCLPVLFALELVCQEWPWVQNAGYAFTLAILFTNQIHKFSHADWVPSWIELLQAKGIILSREAHQCHHQGTFTASYCITTGWLNPWLNHIRFFRTLERWITRVTGALPRQEDRAFTKAGT